MASQEASPEARELALVGKVEMRFALAETESKFQDLLQTYLAPLLLKLASDSAQVRNKVISICQHINTRVKPKGIQLPVAALLKQFQDNPSTPLIRHFDILYIQQGLGRLDKAKQLELLPDLMRGLAANTAINPQHGSQLFHLVLQLLSFYRLPERGSKEDEELRKTLKVADEDAKFLSTWFGKLLLFSLSWSQQDDSSQRNAGLIEEDHKFLTVHGKPEVWNSTASGGLNLVDTKIVVVKAITSGLFTPEERLIPSLFASADSNSNISTIGEDILKRTIANIDINESRIVEALFRLYLGGTSTPVSTVVRIRILNVLAQSTKSISYPEEILQISSDGLLAGDSTRAGRLLQKYRNAIFGYLQAVARHGKPQELQRIAPAIVSQLRDFIENAGWPKQVDGDVSLRGPAYELIGVYGRTISDLITSDADLSLLKFLFRSLEEDISSADTGSSIQEALLTLMRSYSGSFPSSATESRFKQLLLSSMEPDASKAQSPRLRNVQFVTVRFANSCLPYSDVSARWINILAAHQDSRDVVEEGRKGLDPAWHISSADYVDANHDGKREITFPDFSELLNGIFFRRNGLSSEMSSEHMDVDQPNDLNALVRFERDYSIYFATAVEYALLDLFSTILLAAGTKVDLSADWERKIIVLIENDPTVRRTVRDRIQTIVESGQPAAQALSYFMRAAFDLVATQSHVKSVEPVKSFTRLYPLCPETVVRQIQLPDQIKRLEDPILSNDPTRRAVGAHMFGLLASLGNTNSSQLQEALSAYLRRIQSWPDAVGETLNQTIGSTLALAYFFSRAHWSGISSSLENDLKSFLEEIFKILQNAKDGALLDAVCVSLSQLCMFAVLKPSEVVSLIPFDTLIDKLSEGSRKGSSLAIIALGHLGMILEEDEADGDVGEDRPASQMHSIKEKIYSLHDMRDAEAQFSVGEALCILASGWKCKSLAVQLDVVKPPKADVGGESAIYPITPSHEKTLEQMLNKVIADTRSAKPSLKKASVIWLLSLVQLCGDQKAVQEQLRKCQMAFMGCLSSNDQMVQEASSRGLSLVYEHGNQETKDDLIRDLVNLFSENKPSLAGNVTADTELFEAGALPTGSGQSVTTYKDILSLASEVGDSSLVYRFMSLAANSSIWSTRAAFGRFGLSNIFSDSSTEGYLAKNPKLYPKLYRYRFDPNPNVQRSMSDIWDALVKDSSATIREHFDTIMEDLLKNILTKEWRVRQACCGGVAELVQGRSFEMYEKYLGQIWTLCFKVLDDIKESVRAAAASLARVLTNILIRNLESTTGSAKKASAMLKNVIPFLLSTLESAAAEVQALSQGTLLQIIEKSDKQYIRPYVPTLIEEFVGRLSSLEPQALNYIRQKAKHYNLTEEKIDDLRLQGIRGSPVMEAVERCLDALNDDIMADAMTKLHATIKSAIGFPSKVASGRVLVSLSTRHRIIFTPYADKFLSLVMTQVNDPNQHVAVSFATAAGYVSRLATNKAILKMLKKVNKLYFDSEDEASRIVSADIIAALVKHAPDRSNSLHSDLLPFIFFAKHDSAEQVRDVYSRAWDDSVGGALTISLYLKEIIELAKGHIDAARWNIKHTACRTIADAVVNLGSSDINTTNAAIVWPALEESLAGKTWEGKEVTLDALVKFVEKSTAYWKSETKVASQISKIAIREAKRQNDKYQQFSLVALGKVAAAMADRDLSKEVFDVLDPVLEEILPTTSSEAMDVDEEDQSVTTSRVKTLTAILKASFLSLNPSLSSSTQLLHALAIAERINKKKSRDIHLTTFETIRSNFERYSSVEGTQAFIKLDANETNVKLITILLDPSFSDLPEAMRMERAKAIVAISKFCKGRDYETILMKDLVTKAKENEKSPTVKKELEKAS